MRGTRWLILLAIVAVLGSTGYLFLRQTRKVAEQAPPKPPVLAADTGSAAIDYEYVNSSNSLANYHVKARKYRQVRDTPNVELEDLELQLMQADHEHYDKIKSAKALFNRDLGRMYSEGAVEVTLDVPVKAEPSHPLTVIRTSGVTFDSKAGKATTDRETHFTFANGDGQCMGAAYDPSTHELHLLHNAHLTMRSKNPTSPPMRVEADDIVYKESQSRVLLSPWSRLIRGETTVNAGPATVNLKDRLITSIDTTNAKGVETYPKRHVEYSADTLHVDYDDDGNVSKIAAVGNAQLHQTSAAGVTDTHSNSADLMFTPRNGQSVLQQVWARGDARVQSEPAPDKAGKRAESRILKSDTIQIAMRPDGENIEQVQTHTPGTLEFLANAPDQHHRLLNGERMTIAYGERNLIKEFQTNAVTTVTFPPADKKKNAQPSHTASRFLTATFDSKGQLATMRQWENFTYDEGDRKARAATADLDNQKSTMELDKGARIWDSSGSTDADHIHMDQKSGDYQADGHVMTSRIPDQDPKKKKSGEMLDGDQPVQGRAPRMTSANKNKLVHYEGGVVLWQGADRIEAQTVDIDRDHHLLTAAGNVVTQFLDNNQADKKDKDHKQQSAAPAISPIVKVASTTESVPKVPSAPVYTVVKAGKLVYTDTDRLADYSESVVLTRPGLNVKGDELKAFLNPSDSDEDSRLNHAISDGNVEIVDSRLNRQRTGNGDHGEYYTEEDKVILRGNPAAISDTLKGESHGAELTYFTSDDRLLITGSPAKPVASRLNRKTKSNGHSGNR
jgi:lipopolysaccharide export system protein LptA